jgi:putative transcriptional regulator
MGLLVIRHCRIIRLSKMSKRNIGQEILEGIQDIKAHTAGKKTLRTHTFTQPAPPQVIRAKLKLSQSAFADLMGASLRTVQDWEQGRRKPSGPAVALLRIVEQKPEIFSDLS